MLNKAVTGSTYVLSGQWLGHDADDPADCASEHKEHHAKVHVVETVDDWRSERDRSTVHAR